jgi:hypothetical protein
LKQKQSFVYYWCMMNAAEEDWQVLASLFPEGWQEQAKQTGAIERQRGITDLGAIEARMVKMSSPGS